MISSLFLIGLSTYLIWKASASFDLASSFLTRHLSEGIKGPTVNAIASSLPELLISFFFLFYIGDIQGFSAGFATIIGSSIFNIAIIPTASFLIIYYTKGVSIFPTDKKIMNKMGFSVSNGIGACGWVVCWWYFNFIFRHFNFTVWTYIFLVFETWRTVTAKPHH